MTKFGGRPSNGFTIVELLIVVVVIGILAAVAFVAYGSTNQRAVNASRISAAGQVQRLLQLYKNSKEGAYPPGMNTCLTQDNVCTSWNGTVVTASNASLMTALGEVGTPPASIPVSTSAPRYGLHANQRSSTMTVDGNTGSQMLLMYWLDGNNQNCRLGGTVRQGTPTVPEPDPWVTAPASTYYTGNQGTMTVCYVAV